jgi:transcriptional regulator with XRE-family HTH domain
MNKPNKNLIELGIRVREYRTELGLSQEKLAEICKFDRTYISLIERGKRNPSYINLLKLSYGLKKTISELTEGLI